MLDIEMEANEETVALMGASGCGKTMTLRLIAGIAKPDSGIIVINGETVFDSQKKINLPPKRRKTGFLFQDYALFPNMTVEENIRAVLPKEQKGRAGELMEQFCLTGLEKHYESQLSGGQKQRCALARMIASNPQIILLDEPFSALDSYLRWQMEREITSVIRQFGKTVLFVSHDRDEVYRISDRVVVIDHGKSEAIIEKEKLYRNPTTYVDALLTGCKNICPVVEDGEYFAAKEYGIWVPTNHTVRQISYIGFRAKRIYPAHFLPSGTQAIVLEYEIMEQTEAVFSMVLMVRIKGASEMIRWELRKEEYETLDQQEPKLAIPYEEIFFLTR
ncbi:MAG: molybdate transport system ATP-binding protein [Clostridiales bacterium]|nr:molybdate transport system ATP-binding protein [Clostridiales bacterium]